MTTSDSSDSAQASPDAKPATAVHSGAQPATRAQAAAVAATIVANGRAVVEEEIADDLAGLEGLSVTEAGDLELLTYGLTAEGKPTPQFVPDRDSKQTLQWLLGRGRSAVLYVLAAAVLALVPAIAVPLVMRVFVDRYLVAGDLQWARPVLVVLLGSTLLSTILVVLQQAAVRRFALRLSQDNHVGFSWHSLQLPIPVLQRLGAGELIARSNAGQRMAVLGGMMLPLALVNVVNAVAFTIVLLVLNAALGGLALLVIAGTVIVSRGVLGWRSRIQRDVDGRRAELFGATSEVISSVESIKAAAWEQHAFARWSQIRSRYAQSVSRLGVANQWMSLIPAIAVTVSLGLVLAAGSWMVARGTITLGSLVAAQSFTAMLLTSFSMLVYLGVLMQLTASAAEQTTGVLAEPVDPELLADDITGATRATPGQPLSAPVGGDSDVARLRGEVELRGLTFGYDRSAPPLLTDLDLRIEAGARVALVGRSGSGKTTIAKLVVGELRPWSGAVHLDGIARLRLPREQVTASVAYVPQQSVLFPGTIWDNLALWDDNVTEEQLRRAAEDACIAETILARPGGFHAEAQHQDSGFSGGEMQRLSLARALVADPTVLILDEATSALDPVVEAQVDANLRRRQCTCLIVAHRLSTVRDADEILVVDGGQIVQRGPYEAIKDHGYFSELIHG